MATQPASSGRPSVPNATGLNVVMVAGWYQSQDIGELPADRTFEYALLPKGANHESI